LVLFQVGTELVTPTEGWFDVPTDGAVTVPTVCPELPIVPCCTGAPERPLVPLWGLVLDVCAFTANGAAANPRPISAATARLVVVMADPFGRGLSIAMVDGQIESLVHRATNNTTLARMCRLAITARAQHCITMPRNSGRTDAAQHQRIAAVSRSASGTEYSRAFYPFVTAARLQS
jgi:hypothetical protein